MPVRCVSCPCVCARGTRAAAEPAPTEVRLLTACICLAAFSEDAYVADWRFNASLLVQRIDAGEGVKIPGGPISFGCWNFEQTDPVSVCLDGLLMSRLLPSSQPPSLPHSLSHVVAG